MFAYCKNNPVNMQDSCGNKPGDLFAEEIDAIRDAAIYIGALSFSYGWEYSTAVYAMNFIKYVPKTVIEYVFKGNGASTKTISTIYIPQFYKRYTYTAILTDRDPMSVRIPRAPEGHIRVAAIHTHPMGSNKGITQFSDQDKLNTDTIYKCPFYVYGPNGELHKYEPGGTPILVFDDLPVSEKQPWLD